MNFFVKEVVEKKLSTMRKNHKIANFDFEPNFNNRPGIQVAIKWKPKARRWFMFFDFDSAGYLMTEAGISHVKNPVNPSELFDGCEIISLDKKGLVVSTVNCTLDELWWPVNTWLCHMRLILEEADTLIKKEK